MLMSALVSIVIPLHNCERFIAEAVRSALNQTHKNIEIIFVDDGSTDSTAKILDRYKEGSNINVIRHENYANKGVGLSRQLGIYASNGEYIAF